MGGARAGFWVALLAGCTAIIDVSGPLPDDDSTDGVDLSTLETGPRDARVDGAAPDCTPTGTEICDRIDNDCDGTIDEETGRGGRCLTAIGACGRVGVLDCDPNGELICVGERGEPLIETCNGEDDDCDGEIDEGLGVGESCVVRQQACESPGIQICGANGDVVCDAPPVLVTAERCNHVDDDCDGVVDNGFEVGAPCETGVGACRASGERICDAAGATVCDASPHPAGDEICNGVDDDCDGEIDQGFDVGTPCTVGLGECAREDLLHCNADGERLCSAEPGAGADEQCNGLDDDCDGEVDEDFAAMLGQACVLGTGVCEMAGERVCSGPDGPQGLYFAGIRADLPIADVIAGGFERCWSSPYDQHSLPLDEILSACDGSVLLMGCRQTAGAASTGMLDLAAMGERDQVLFDVGTEPDAVHTHNGVDFYFNGSSSWGFAPEGLGVARRTCDAGGEQPHLRMCWHMSDGRINSGYRCGDNAPNESDTWERVLYHHDGALRTGRPVMCNARPRPGEPESCDGVDNDCDGVIDNVAGVGVPCSVGRGQCEAHGIYVCGDGQAAGGLYRSGIQIGLSEQVVTEGGFQLCFRSLYGQRHALDDIGASCQADILLMACRQLGAPVFTTAAMGWRHVIVRDLGSAESPVNIDNGVNWYFGQDHSWGFGPPGEALRRVPCDVAEPNRDDRLCWNTQDGNLAAGYRCGRRVSNGDDHERLVYHRPGPLAEGLVCNADPGRPREEICNGQDDDCDGEIDEEISCPP